MPHAHTGSSFQTASPEDVLSPAAASDSGRSFASGNSFEGRNRSGSVHSHKTLLQVTMDNEQFILVDVTGMTSADGIKDRVFAKVCPVVNSYQYRADIQMRLRDDDYSAYSFFRTEIGEAAAPSPLSSDQLLSVCLSEGDAKATLKFLIIQNHPTGSSASVVPPMQMPEASTARRLPPIDTQLNRNSKDGSTSSATTDRHAWSDASHPESSTSYERQSGKGGSIGASGSSRSLQDAVGGSGSRMNSPSTHHVNPHSPIYGHQQSQAGPSSSRAPQSPLGLGLGVSGVVDDDMDDATRALIAQLELEDQEAARAEDERRRQMQEDERIARQAQQNERDEWQAMQRQELEGSRRRQEQIERDEQRAVSWSICGCMHRGQTNE
jgi:mitogen-activated protein kinase kinase kinase